MYYCAALCCLPPYKFRPRRILARDRLSYRSLASAWEIAGPLRSMQGNWAPFTKLQIKIVVLFFSKLNLNN